MYIVRVRLVYPHRSASAQYYADIAHWSESSTVQSACSVEPGTAQDVAVIVRFLPTFPLPLCAVSTPSPSLNASL